MAEGKREREGGRMGIKQRGGKIHSVGKKRGEKE